ncbi:MAG TPA: hypothetical protein VGZ22_02545 [Isosphaeraceae bacterium]|nr:hypothetical protein [Isosphaeraceae bacterium]
MASRIAAAVVRVWPRWLPAGLVGMCCLVLAVESVLARHALKFSNPVGLEWQWSARAAERKVKGCEVLCFGDSTTKLGVLPRALESRSGKRAYNLAMGGAEVPAHYYLLRRALRAGARPSAVVMGCLPRLLQSGPQRNAEIWPYMLTTADCADLAWNARDASLFAALITARWVPSIRYRFPLRDAIKKGWRKEFDHNRRTARIIAQHWDLHQGAMPLGSLPPGKSHPPVAQWGSGFFGDLACLDINAVYIRRFLKLAQDEQIKVYWLVLPIVPELHEWCQQHGFDASYTCYLQSLQRKFPDLTIVDARAAHYDPAVFQDPHHLGFAGAMAYSMDLGDVLHDDALGTTPRTFWRSMPSYRPLEQHFPVEDPGRSQLALRHDLLPSQVQRR